MIRVLNLIQKQAEVSAQLVGGQHLASADQFLLRHELREIMAEAEALKTEDFYFPKNVQIAVPFEFTPACPDNQSYKEKVKAVFKRLFPHTH